MSETENAISSLDRFFSSLVVTPRREFLAKGTALIAAAAAGTGTLLAKESKGAVQAVATEKDREYMTQAIKLMRQAGVVDRTGGPFGAVVVKDGEIIGSAGNSVLRDNDPTGHAEVNAIRAACKKVGSPHITGATLYSSCEPCPMCYSTAYWARVGKIFYGAAWKDYKDLFDDQAIAQDMKKTLGQRSIAAAEIMRPEADAVWQEYRALPDTKRY
ncbi:nucleoside deaminase [Methylocystis sp.]|uniref:nucleoside deaminase n=1 Tax=Methylocystis sp. TaxID=1911079 RepID=UPI0025E3F892|nr:nucleoside deaminase [Methylocystis sp.]